MTKPNDAPAFPGFDAPPYGSYRGLTLRDYFAGQYITGCGFMGSSWLGFPITPEAIAQTAYRIADAMLSERDKA